MTQQDHYAYGYWHSAGQACPITAAGKDDHEWATEVAEDFDDKVQTMFGLESTEGVVSAEKAKQAWEKIIEINKTQLNDPEDEALKAMYRERVELAKEVKEQLFEDD